MKKYFYLLGLLLIALNSTKAQLNLGGIHANFGVDADTRSRYSKLGPVTNTVADDWFGYAGGKGVIDTTKISQYRTDLQNGRNIAFMKNMSVPAHSIVDGRVWIDAIYLRDFSGYAGKDSSGFGTSAKNGEDPRSWDGKATNIPAKTDLLDCFAHLRRDGPTMNDSLWFFAGASTTATEGDRYFDIELFKSHVGYDRSTGQFSSDGPSNGHTEWLFDPLGNVLQTGDLIIAVSYNPGSAPTIEVRIWVSKITQLLIKPKLFKFTGTMDGGSLAGYATIVSKSGGTAFGSGIANFSGNNNVAKDSTYSTPWGPATKSGWAQNFSQLQFVEVGLNFTRMGLDPASYGLTAITCERVFHSIFFKSRSSSSFSANLQDHAGPVSFKETPTFDDMMFKTDTLTCSKKMGTLSAWTPTGIGYFHWSTIDGNIVGNPDSSSVNVNKPGTYILNASLIVGCPTVKTQIVTVLADVEPPVANADLGLTADGEYQLVGGVSPVNTLLSPFGPSKGVTYNWTGPNGFSSDLQNPIIPLDAAWGAYHLTVTELRNGCKSWAWMDVSFKARKDQVALESTTVADGIITLAKSQTSNMLSVTTNQPADANARVSIYNASGQVVNNFNVKFTKGYNNIQLPVQASNSARIVSVYIGNKLVTTKKILF